MSKALRVTLWSVLGLVVLVVVGIGIFVATFDANAWKPRVVAAVKERTGRTLTLEGDVSLTFFPKLGVSLGRAALSGKGGKGTFAKVDEVRVAVALLPLLRGAVEVDRVTLRGLDVDLLRHKDGSTNFDDLGEQQSKPAARDERKQAPAASPAHVDVSGVTITDATIRWTDERAGTRSVVSGLGLTTGRIADGVRAEGQLAGQVRQEPGGRVVRFKASTGYRLAIERKAVELDALKADVALEGQGKPLAIELTGALAADGAKQTAKADLGGSIDGARFTLKADVAGFTNPRVRFDLAADKLDLDALKGGAAPAPSAAPASKSASPVAGATAPRAETPIDLSALKGLDASGQVHLGAVVVSGIHAQKLEASVKVAGGRAAIDPMTATLYDGKVAGAIGVDANEDRYTVRQTLTDVALGPLLRDVARKDVVEGRGTVTIDVHTHGRTVDALERALEGGAKVAVRDGALKGVNLGEIARQARALTRRDGPAIASSGTEKTDFTELTATFAIREGIARSTDLEGKSPLLRLGGAGQIDIPAGTVDYTLRVGIVATSTGQGGKEAGQVRGVTVPVIVSGPFEALQYRVDYAGAAAETLKDEASRRIEDALKGRVDENARGRIGEALKGLLGR